MSHRARRRCHHSRLVLGALVVALSPLAVSCSPAVRVRSQVELPASIGKPDRSRLHISAATARNAGPLPAPPPASGRPAGASRVEVAPSATGFDVELAFSGKQVYVNLTAWYDADADGTVNTGDAVGSLSGGPAFAEDRGACNGNLTVIAPIPLKQVF